MAMQIDFVDAEDFSDLFSGRDLRGWAMRRGHCRRLMAETGRESTRGRTAFARSLNRVKRLPQECIRLCTKKQRLDLLKEAAISDFRIAHPCKGSWESSWANLSNLPQRLNGDRVGLSSPHLSSQEFHQELSPSLAEQRHVEAVIGEPHLQKDASSDFAGSPPSPELQRSTSVPCIAAEMSCAAQHMESVAVPLKLWRSSRPCCMSEELAPLQRPIAPFHVDFMLEALATAEQFSGLPLACSKGRTSQWRKDRKLKRSDDANTFAKIRAKFLHDFGEEVRVALSDVWGSEIHLQPAPLAAEVASRFAATYVTCQTARLRVTLHGTDVANHPSIFRQGLLVPSRGSSSISIKHGASHGNGIYSATLGNAALATGFCNARRILVCSVIDDAVELDQQQRCGNFWITKESTKVRYVGDAVVVFDPARIAPLFEASVPCDPLHSTELHSDSSIDSGSAQAGEACERFKFLQSKRHGRHAAFLARRAVRRRR